jgi:4-hydroxy-L-threonine phosphate dehydrogenase PdxA
MIDKITIAIVPGAEDGVGPELLLKALATYKPVTYLRFYWCGDLSSLRLAITRNNFALTLNEKNQAIIDGFNIPLSYGEDCPEKSLLARQAHFLKTSVILAKQSLVQAIVTGPINKDALR